MSYYLASYQDRAPVRCDVSTGCLLQSKSLYNCVCERDQLRTFRKLGASSEKQSDTNSQGVVPRGAFEHSVSGPRDTTILAADHNLVSSRPYSSRQGSSTSDLTTLQTAMVLPGSHCTPPPPLGTEGCTSSVPSSSAMTSSYAYDKPISYPPAFSFSTSSFSSPRNSFPSSAQEFRTLATQGSHSDPSVVATQGSHSGPSVMILMHPSDIVVSVGERAEFSCKAIVQGSVTKPRYMWCKDNEPLVWEIGHRCVIESVNVEDAGQYLCLVSDPQGQVTMKSCSARLIVKSSSSTKVEHTLEILKQPEKNIEVVLGKPLRLEVVVKGNPPPTYQWYKDTVALPYATAAVLEIDSMASSNEGDYCCSMTNSMGSRLSACCTVRALLPRSSRTQKPTSLPGLIPVDLPSDNRQSALKSYSSGSEQNEEPIYQAFLLSLASKVSTQRCSPFRLGSYLELTSQEVADIVHQATSDKERTYLMLRRWVERKRKGKGTLLAILSKAGLYTDVEEEKSTKSDDPPKLRIHVYPQNPVCYGNSVTLRVLTDHTHHHHLPLWYQWYKDGRPLERRRSRELSIHSFTQGDCGEYTCSVTTPDGDVLHTHPTQVTMLRENPLKRVPPNYGVMVTNTPKPPRGGVVVAAPSHLYYGDGDVEMQREVGVLAQPSGRAGCTWSKGKSLRIITHPQSQELQPGDPLTITCTADGPSPLSYLWLFNGLPLINETEPTYRINCFTDEDEGLYACEVTASDGSSVLSDFAEIKMNLDD